MAEHKPLGIDLEAQIIRVDNTAMDELRTCPAKFNAHIIKGLKRQADTESETQPLDLHYGSAWHLAMDTMWEGGELSQAQDVWLKASQGMAEDKYNRKTPGRGLEDLEDYWTRYQTDIESIELLQSEIVASTRIDMGAGWFLDYVGAIDKVARAPGTDVIRVTDHKTTGYVNSHTGAAYELSNQLKGYAYIVREFFFGGDPNMAIMVEADIVAPTRAKPPSEFLRPQIIATSDSLDEWKEHIVATAWTAVGYAQRDIWPAWGHKACTQYNRLCPYFDLCVTNKEVRHVVEQAQYTESRWHPSDRE